MILGIAAVYFVYNSGYWLPFGGGTPGPRFLIPALPFVALGLATAYRRLPALTLGLAIPSAMFMVIGSLTYPLIGRQGIGTWADWLVEGNLEHTVLTAFGVTNAWLALAPFFAAVVTAIVLAVRATPSWAMSDFSRSPPSSPGRGLRRSGPRWRAMRSARWSAETSPLSGWSRRAPCSRSGPWPRSASGSARSVRPGSTAGSGALARTGARVRRDLVEDQAGELISA